MKKLHLYLIIFVFFLIGLVGCEQEGSILYKGSKTAKVTVTAYPYDDSKETISLKTAR